MRYLKKDNAGKENPKKDNSEQTTTFKRRTVTRGIRKMTNLKGEI